MPGFSDGPVNIHEADTYPAETVFYLGDMATVKEKDNIEGVISCKPNEKNPRDLDIVIDFKVDGAHPMSEKREYRM